MKYVLIIILLYVIFPLKIFSQLPSGQRDSLGKAQGVFLLQEVFYNQHCTSVAQYKDDTLNGSFFIYSTSGILYYECNYEMGKKIGRAAYYSKDNGRLISVLNYYSDTTGVIIEFNKKGRIIVEKSFGTKITYRYSYFPKGKVYSKEILTDSERHKTGMEIIYYKNGNLKRIDIFENYNTVGIYSYKRNGELLDSWGIKADQYNHLLLNDFISNGLPRSHSKKN
jgi:antitoxin component YwqK of YwqJK toxin-antitoxin module